MLRLAPRYRLSIRNSFQIMQKRLIENDLSKVVCHLKFVSDAVKVLAMKIDGRSASKQDLRFILRGIFHPPKQGAEALCPGLKLVSHLLKMFNVYKIFVNAFLFVRILNLRENHI
jgi:hypothetical protein